MTSDQVYLVANILRMSSATTIAAVKVIVYGVPVREAAKAHGMHPTNLYRAIRSIRTLDDEIREDYYVTHQ